MSYALHWHNALYGLTVQCLHPLCGTLGAEKEKDFKVTLFAYCPVCSMALLTVFTDNVIRQYRTSIVSKGLLFQLVVFVTTIVVPFFVAYSSRGLIILINFQLNFTRFLTVLCAS